MQPAPHPTDAVFRQTRDTLRDAYLSKEPVTLNGQTYLVKSRLLANTSNKTPGMMMELGIESIEAGGEWLQTRYTGKDIITVIVDDQMHVFNLQNTAFAEL